MTHNEDDGERPVRLSAVCVSQDERQEWRQVTDVCAFLCDAHTGCP